MRSTILATLALALSACAPAAPTSDESCDGVVQRIEACGGTVAANFREACAQSAGGADAYEDLACEDLLQALADHSKGDGDFLVDLEQGSRCLFNFQCAGDLTCRPVSLDFELSRCEPRGNPGLCNDDNDCVDDWECMYSSGGGQVCYEY
jgi:hypothetical protein